MVQEHKVKECIDWQDVSVHYAPEQDNPPKSLVLCVQAMPHPGKQAATPQQSMRDTQRLQIRDLIRLDTWRKLPGCAQSLGRNLKTGMWIRALCEMQRLPAVT